MRPIWIIAKNTFREIIRDRILYGILVFAILLIGLSLALGQLSFSEQGRISVNFGFTGIQMSAAILAIFVGSSLVSKEIEKQTILTLLARPLSRTQFLIGKFMGLGLVITTVMLGLAAILSLTVASLGFSIELSFFIALYGILLEALVLVCLALLFGSFARPIMTVTFTVALFLIGHWVESLEFFSTKSESEAFRAVAKVISIAVPNLEKFNWRAMPVYGDVLPATQVLASTAYAGAWLVFLLTATSLVFRRRDFV